MNELNTLTLITDEPFEDEANFRRTPMERFMDKIEILDNGCWLWKSVTNNKMPHGRFRFEGKYWLAHRWIYEQTYGPVPDGLVLDHYLFPQDGCIGPRCANPDHVKPVTMRENTLRGNGITAINARKTKCPEGHAYDAKRDSRGFRVCSTCILAQRRERRAA
ncbi:HNH endonuclease signature motif containing protein [Microbispora bryophytorum]|uniref:HNH endonuclease signature motif containing protein n=1 Tax=Microbispora bryophytorum TaxID=1460882 RepID=UPI0033E036A2